MIKVKVIKGPQFKFVEEKAYKILHDILINKHFGDVHKSVVSR